MSNLIQVLPNGEQHGLINRLANSVPFDDFKYMDGPTKLKAEKKRKDDAILIKAQYLNSRGKHERLTKPYCGGSGMPIEIWHFVPGKEYTVPKGLVEDVNKSRPIIRAGKCDENGDNPTTQDEYDEPLHRFVAVGF